MFICCEPREKGAAEAPHLVMYRGLGAIGGINGKDIEERGQGEFVCEREKQRELHKEGHELSFWVRLRMEAQWSKDLHWVAVRLF